jgi:hypothetical protein
VPVACKKTEVFLHTVKFTEFDIIVGGGGVTQETPLFSSAKDLSLAKLTNDNVKNKMEVKIVFI